MLPYFLYYRNMEITVEYNKIFSDKTRLSIIMALLIQPELCVCQLLDLLDLKGATLSAHLSKMVHAKVLQARKDSRWIFYRLHSDFPEWVQTFIVHLKLLPEYQQLQEKIQNSLLAVDLGMC
jgi:ArsR family transcriptional regulator